MMTEKEKEYYIWATAQLQSLRGAALNLSTDIELLVGEIIATHFCEHDSSLKNEFLAVVINHRDLTFSSLINILEDILKHSYPNVNGAVI